MPIPKSLECLPETIALIILDFGYSGIHLNELRHSPLLAGGEGVGGGVLVSDLTDNRYIFNPKSKTTIN